MERRYHIIEKENTEAVRGFLSKNGQALLPLVEQIEQAEVALDELIDALGRATVETVLRLSASGSPAHRIRGRKAGRWGGMGERKARSV